MSIKKGEKFMKILKRLIAVAVIVALVLLVSYLIYTGGQVNAQGG